MKARWREEKREGGGNGCRSGIKGEEVGAGEDEGNKEGGGGG